MIHNVKILIFICFFTACSSTEQKEIVTAGELLRQAAFYGERLQFLPALETYQQAIKLAEKEKDSAVFSLAYLEMGKIYRYQSLKQKALQSEKKALSYIKSPACDSLRLELYREIGDMYTLSGQADSAFHYYEMAGCRIKQAKILQQNGSNKEAETLLKTELEQTIFPKEKARVLAEQDLELIEKIARHMTCIQTQVEAMVETRKVINKMGDIREKAIAYHDRIAPTFEEIRAHIDKLELIVDNEMWTLPKYRELLFLR